MIGVYNIIKPTGFTSSDVVVKMRGILRRYYGIKNIKVGHLGTLDPSGSGVLPIVVGKATKLFDYFSKSSKVYRTEFIFGITTDTLDSQGIVVDKNDRIIGAEEIKMVIPKFLGKIEQVPPQYSRVSVDGVRGYSAARQGITIDMPTRSVAINNIEIIKCDSNRITMDIDCSGGTYIRSLARDMANALSTVAYMSYIIRLQTKGLTVNDGITITEMEQDIEGKLLDIECLIGDIPHYAIDDRKKILNGLPVEPLGVVGDYVATIENKIYGICRDYDGGIETLINLYEY